MDAIETITGRKVVRAYLDKPVELEKVNRIIAAGRHAMSARNQQPWQFVVIRNRDTLREVGAMLDGPVRHGRPLRDRRSEGRVQRAMGGCRLRTGGAEHG